MRLPEPTNLARFEQAILPHLAAAYNVARWLTRDEHDAEDVVQEAYVRALTFFDSFHGGNSRAWLLTMVRHTCYTWLQHHRPPDRTTEFDEEIHSLDGETSNPETLLLQRANQQLLREALEALPLDIEKWWSCANWRGCRIRRSPTSLTCPSGRSYRVWPGRASGCRPGWLIACTRRSNTIAR